MNATYEQFIKNMSTEDLADAIVSNDILRMCCSDAEACCGNCKECLAAYLNKEIDS